MPTVTASPKSAEALTARATRAGRKFIRGDPKNPATQDIPDLQYAVKFKKAYYGLPKQGWIIEMVAYDVSVNLVFFGGAEFDSPPPLGEGSRYVKVKTLEDAKAPKMREWIEQASRSAGWK